MRRVRTRSALAAAGVGAVLLALGSAGGAVAAESPALTIHDSAVLVARGAAVSVNVEVTCSENSWWPDVPLTVEVWQRVGNETAHGSADTRVACTGFAEVVQVAIPASGPKAFRVGPAYVEAQTYVSGVGYLTDQETVSVRGR